MPIIGVIIEVFYFYFLRQHLTFSFYVNSKDLSTAILSFSIAMFGIIAMVVTLVYGLNSPGPKSYLRKFGIEYAFLWGSCIVLLTMAGFISLLGFAKTELLALTILLKVLVWFFITGFLQSLMTIFVSMMVLIKSNHVQ